MTKFKVFYFNDREKSAGVRVLRSDDEGYEVRAVLSPGEGRYFEVEAPDGMVPFIKVWETNQVLISWIDPCCTFDSPPEAA